MTLLRRRLLISALTPIAAPTAIASSEQLITRWLLGIWQSDRDRTMENYHLGGEGIPESKREDVASLFGQLTYEISGTTFAINDTYRGDRNDKVVLKYTVQSHTDSSITLALRGSFPMTSLTLYRFSNDLMFGRSGKNLEYFKRIAGHASRSK